jgi:hypothetical protein
MAAAMVQSPQQALPKQMSDWADLKAAYRLLSSDRIEPRAIGQPHRQQTLAQCAGQGVVLCVQDGSDLQSVKVAGDHYVQHSTLAVLPQGAVLGLLDQRWYERIEASADETRLERSQRWRESDVWTEPPTAIGPAPREAHLVHVADRAADDLHVMAACADQGHGFVIRAKHNRRVNDGTDKLWPALQAQPQADAMTVEQGTQRHNGRITRRGRRAEVTVQYTTVHLDRPWNHPGEAPARTVNAVYLSEPEPPADAEPIDWLVLTSEPVSSVDDAKRIIGYYQKRWVIEQWHRCLKEGCRLEQSHLDSPEDLQRLAAIQSIIAVRLIQWRDTADPDKRQADEPTTLQQIVPWLWICLVAGWRQTQPETLTPRQFYEAVAKRGGWPGRNNDPRPGWLVLWRGFYDLQQMAHGVETMQNHPHPPK